MNPAGPSRDPNAPVLYKARTWRWYRSRAIYRTGMRFAIRFPRYGVQIRKFSLRMSWTGKRGGF